MSLPLPPAVPSVRTELEQLDPRFADVRGDAWVERLFTGCRWTEGPVYVPAWRCLVWSDVPSDRVLRWDETTGEVGVFRQPSRHANGATLDPQGRLVTCEQGARRVVRTEHDASLSVLADTYEGKRFNSPNDVVVSADGAVWFTDPAYGIDDDYEGHRAESEIGACHVYRVDPRTGECRVAADGLDRPNGLAFSPDERVLYVTDSGRGDLRAFAVGGAGALSGGDVVAECTAGVFDGVRVDTAGRLWAAAADGVHCLAPDGTLLGRLRLPETTANLVFGGPRRNRLFVTATTSVYSVLLSVTGATRPVR
jgi:gluconolactonase